ncbi:MAG: hypothetical protein HC888_18435 [Candidatus Competibacteraceae bacterium]|nr:hypothetical protein [Candidatus Competibacteraceae bacterium]
MVTWERVNRTEVMVSATLANDVTPGPLCEIVLLSAWRNGVQIASRELSVLGKVLGPIAASPDNLSWDMNKEDAQHVRALSLSRADGKAISVKLSENLSELLTAQANGSTIAVQLRPGADRINNAEYASKVVGSMSVVDGTSTVLRVPIVIMGR